MQQQEYGDDGPFGGLPTVADHITKEVPKNVGGQKRCKYAGAWVLQWLKGSAHLVHYQLSTSFTFRLHYHEPFT